MAKTTFEQADAAATELQKKLGNKSWFLGAGVGKENGEFVVALRVEHAAPANEIPQMVAQVPIQVGRQSMAKAQ